MGTSYYIINKARPVHIWFLDPWRVNGISFLIWRNFFARCIARSTWILNEAMAWLPLTSAFVSWLLVVSPLLLVVFSQPFKKAGILSDTPILSTSSDIKNPRSVIMLSFFAQSASFSKPLRRKIYLSEIDPGYKLLIKVTAPDGAIHIRPL